MCEQTPVEYKDGDIVWVKLGPCWWPGEVRELSKLPPEWFADFRKPPITAVKFFNEDTYEYVRSIDKIYSYNCTKKNEFIKKGLDLYRAKNSFMDKFPADVSTAEQRTNGDPNIIESPLFTPEKKTNFAAILFGSSKPKKPSRKSGGGHKRHSSSSSSGLSPGSSKGMANKMITHPRFLGRDDHEVRILVQSPDKAETGNQEIESTYNCTSCGFTTSRIDVIVLHNKSHIQGVYSTPTSTVKKSKKSTVKRGKKALKMTRSKTSSIYEDLALIEKGLLLSTESSDEDVVEDWDAEPKRKRKKNKRKSKKVQAKKEETKLDIRDNLLAEWEDDSEEAKDVNINTSSTVESDISMSKVDELNKTADQVDSPKKDVDKSCFDFEEEEDSEIIGTSVGRKIPRVIPHAEKQKTVDPGISEANLPTAEDDVNRNEQIKEIDDTIKNAVSDNVDKKVEAEVEEDKSEDPNVDAFKDILEATAVPDLPEIPHALKYEQNFHNARTIKFPDKPATESALEDKALVSKPEVKEVAEVATKLINPKKRFVKSFEDFEQQWNNEQRKLAEFEEHQKSEQSKSEELQNSEHDQLLKSDEQQADSEKNKLTELAQQVRDDQEELLEPELQPPREEEKVMELQQQPEKTASVVEVSKLKTQLMSKLESAEKLLPMEQSKNKRLETPKQSRFLRERIFEKQKEEKTDDLWLAKQSSLNKSHVTELLSPKTKHSDSSQPKSPHEAKTFEISEIHGMEESQALETIRKKSERFNYKDMAKSDVKPETKTRSRFTKSRRLSVKMPEVEETFEIEQTAELLELEETKVMQVEQAKVLEVQESIEVPQVGHIVTETPTTESQINNESQINVISDSSEIFEEKTIESNIELNKEQPVAELEDLLIDNLDVSNENSQGNISEKNITPLSETPVSEVHKEDDLSKIEEAPLDNSLEVKQTNNLQLSETPPESEESKAVDEFISMQLNNVGAEQEVHKTVDTEINLSMQTSMGSGFSKNSEDLSALSTLAAVSELSTNLDMQGSSHDEKSKIIEGNLASVSDITSCLDVHSNSSEKSKILEGGNLKFVTEDDLADGQVEIADVSSIDKHKSKPITLSSFSVDFTDPSQTVNTHMSLPNDTRKVSVETPVVTNTTSRTNKRKRCRDLDHSEVIEKSLEKVFEDEIRCSTTSNIQNTKSMKLTNVTAKSDCVDSPDIQDANNCDIEDQIPSLVVCSSIQPGMLSPKVNYLENPLDPPEYTSSSKLLEILTDGKPKSTKMESVTSQKLPNIYDMPPHSSCKTDSKLPAAVSKETVSIAKSVPKFDPKNSKFVIKSTIPAKINVPAASKSNKPIILSEKIIKPISEVESVSVQKVTSKRNAQDIDDIDTFIIQKSAKKMMISQEIDVNETLPVLAQTIKKSGVPRGKAKILQQTIIKPAGEVIQPSTTHPATTTFSAAAISQTPIDDNMFDINSMPIVLGDQILTAETIENMPVVLSDSVQPACSKTVNASVATVSKSQSEQTNLLNKPTSVTTQSILVKTYSSQKLAKSPRVFATSTTKVVKSNPAIITCTGKSDKFVIVPSGSSTPSGSKYTVGKRPPIVKRSSPVILPTPTSTTKVQTAPSSEPTGNKIMIVTNQQGRQSRVLLTPAQQKLLGYQATGSKLVKNTLKGNILQKASNAKSSGISPLPNVAAPKVPSMISHAIVNSKGEIISTSNQNLITSDGQVLMPVKSQHIRGLKTDAPKGGRKIQMQSQKVLLQEGLNTLKSSNIPAQQKTIVIKNQQGQIVKKFQGTDDALLEQQVAEQVQAIKASGSFSSMKAKQEVSTSKIKPGVRRSYPKKSPAVETTRSTSKTQMVLNTSVGFTPPALQKTEASVPPLAPISPKRSDTLLLSQPVPKLDEIKLDASSALKDVAKPKQIQQKPLNQLIIQDALGNQTTITEGQILALPSGETIDGQPQSYMLVTLDESGNLAPLNNEALLSLDPNLCLGGDLSNMVLQIDEGSGTTKQDSADTTKAAETSANNSDIKEVPAPQNTETVQKEMQQPNVVMPVPVQEQLTEDKSVIPENVSVTNHGSGLLTSAEPVDTTQQNLETVQAVTCSIGSDPNQQLIITGDPITTQKFIESLTEANPDLANLLASAEGNILIQTDEQQILINTDAENQVLLPMNAENLGVIENSEGDGNPIFATQPSKNQDILAAALADTDVFQQEQTASPTQVKVSQSQLSPNSGLYPSGVSNVLGTTLSLSSPIMTPLEVPSSNSKKIPDEETGILTTEVPKNVDLPITITDPNISQTVAQQQVASLIASELTSNLDLPLTISDQGAPLTSAEMNSPSYVYSLPSLDESVDIHPKTFSGPISMPLLNEEPQEAPAAETSASGIDSKSELTEKIIEEKETVSTGAEVNVQPPSNPDLHTSAVNEVSALFEASTLVASDCMKDDKLQSTSRTFMGTIETEEGLCTLGGAMCSSLSEPPPDMFDLSVVNSTYVTDTGIKEHIEPNIPEATIVSNVSGNITESCTSKPVDCDLEVNLSANEQNASIEDYDKYESYDTESRNDGTPLSNIPLNSESSSPAINIDENSCEIPVQPQIVTDLSSSSFETLETTDSADIDSNKRISADDSIESEKKKINFD